MKRLLSSIFRMGSCSSKNPQGPKEVERPVLAAWDVNELPSTFGEVQGSFWKWKVPLRNRLRPSTRSDWRRSLSTAAFLHPNSWYPSTTTFKRRVEDLEPE